MAIVKGTVVKGHRVASEESRDPRYPHGTIAMQVPKFMQLGLDLLGFHKGTVNVSVSPLQFKVIKPVIRRYPSTEKNGTAGTSIIRIQRPSLSIFKALVSSNS